ncbi:sphingomyelin phosphodiesterase 4, neutral membrane (neutral sphingomyelinase-3) [Geranomyces variabilis]|uniref:Sphingomyelin phosphodiesterase 4, neutral membrane (Neutral sphingomyelinase-3) n=1 Tax=Geranomyces variabilis TaxID=109894 RepID=A0AAD5XMK0_9FUNG|nr:sphingomyelin phosphodiesterase 4, neutral membrane (neutral sphingomyelinase-3) [Geranomyces variabilis]
MSLASEAMETNHPLARLVSATDPRSFFTAVQAVEQWLADQGDITLAKPMHRFLSRITLKLYGGGNEPCYLLRNLAADEKSILQRFLWPTGLFFRTLLKTHDRALLYEIKFDQLPAPTRKVISSLEWSQLPALYNQRLEQEDNSRTAGHIGATPGKRGRPTSVKIMFNMFEYYMYSFALCATQKLAGNPVFNSIASQAPGQPRPGLLSGIPFPKTVSGPWQKGGAAEQSGTPLHPIYFELAAAYLSFFLPSTPPKEDTGDQPQQPYPSSPLRNRFDPRGANSLSTRAPLTPVRQGLNRAFNKAENLWRHETPQQKPTSTSVAPPASTAPANIFTAHEVDTGQRRLASEFVIGTFVEIWLCQNDTTTLSSPSKSGKANPAYIKPTDAQIMTVSALVNQTVTSDFYETFRATADRNRDYLGYEVHSARARAYQIVRPKLYWFLRTALDHWPREDSVASIVDLWLIYITPWKRQDAGAKYNDQWLQFVHDNFMFYTVLFARFLHRARAFDVYASVRPISSVSGTKTFNKNYLSIIERVLAAFDDDMLLSVLRAVESAIFSLDSKSNFGGSKFSSKDLSAGLNDDDAHARMLQTLVNSGHDSKQKITQLGEKKEDLRPVFLLERHRRTQPGSGEVETKAADEAYALMGNLVDAKERLVHYLEGASSNRGPMSPIGPSTPGPLSRSTSFMSASGNAPALNLPPRSLAVHPKFPSFPTGDVTAQAVFGWLFQCWLVFVIASVTLAHGLGLRCLQLMTQQTDEDTRSAKAAAVSGTQEAVRANVNRLDLCLDRFEDLWGGKLKKPEPSRAGANSAPQTPTTPSAPSPPSRRASTTEVVGSEEVVFKTVAPSVLGPEERVTRNELVVLTSRGREQLTKGFRMPEKDSPPNATRERAEGLILSEESVWLVRFWAWVAAKLDEQYARLRISHPQLPAIPSFQWLRHFAAPRNILFWTLGLTVVVVTLKVFGAIVGALMAGGGGPPSITTGGRARPAHSQPKFQSPHERAGNSHAYGRGARAGGPS